MPRQEYYEHGSPAVLGQFHYKTLIIISNISPCVNTFYEIFYFFHFFSCFYISFKDGENSKTDYSIGLVPYKTLPFKKIRFFAYKYLTFTDQWYIIVSEGD